MSDLPDYYWDDRRKRFVLHAFDKLFKNGDGVLRFHHYKASIVVTGGGVWLYTDADFDRLIKLINKARKACLRGPALKATKYNEALAEATKKHRKVTQRRRRA